MLASETYSYDAMSRVATITRGNGVTTTNTWTGHNQLNTQRTTTASGTLVEAHAYTYDTHGNLATRTDTDPAVSTTPSSAGTWTTAYRYDAYNRLLSSATYSGPNTAGQPATATGYTINTAGDVTGTTITTRPQNGAQQQPPAKTQKPKKPKKNPRPGATPPPFTTTTSNTIDPAGQLTAQTSNGTTTTQTFDTEGRITHTLTGTAITYDPFDRMLTATHAGTTATYAYWPDGTPRSTTTSGSGAASTQTFHYGTDGTLVNDTTADATTGAAATTASYLLTAGREARTLATRHHHHRRPSHQRCVNTGHHRHRRRIPAARPALLCHRADRHHRSSHRHLPLQRLRRPHPTQRTIRAQLEPRARRTGQSIPIHRSHAG